MAGAITSTNNITLPALSARLTHIFTGGINEELNSNVDLYRELQAKGRVVKGKGGLIEKKYHIGRNSGVGWNTETGAVGAADVQDYTNGYGSWYILQAPFQVTDLKMDAAGGGASADGIAGIVEDEVERAVNDLVVTLETSLQGLQSDVSNSCYGIQDWVYDGSTGTVFGVDRAVHGFFQTTVLDNGGSNRAITKALLNEAFRSMVFGSGAVKTGSSTSLAAADQGGSKPTHLICTGGMADKYDEVLLGANPRFNIMKNAAGLDIGVTEATFKNVQFLPSRFAEANQIRFIDINDFELHILPHYYSLGSEDKVRESAVAVKMLGRTGSFLKGYLEMRMNLVCNKPHAQVLLDDITE